VAPLTRSALCPRSPTASQTRRSRWGDRGAPATSIACPFAALAAELRDEGLAVTPDAVDAMRASRLACARAPPTFGTGHCVVYPELVANVQWTEGRRLACDPVDAARAPRPGELVLSFVAYGASTDARATR
jgi:hypothetical protein